jgi:hypothetical protein
VLSSDQRHPRGKVTHSTHTLTYDTHAGTRPLTPDPRTTHHYGSQRKHMSLTMSGRRAGDDRAARQGGTGGTGRCRPGRP